MKKYMNETEKYEKWKKDFSIEIQKELDTIFKNNVFSPTINILDLNKWNIEFQIVGTEERIKKIKNIIDKDFILQKFISCKSIDKNIKEILISYKRYRIELKVSAISEEMLFSKLFYLKSYFR